MSDASFDLSIDPLKICRSDYCDRTDLHPVHMVRCRKEAKPRSCRSPWLLPAPNALDDSIVRAVSDIVPLHFAAIVDRVEHDYGSLGHNRDSGIRKVHRRLASLVNFGRVLRVDVGRQLFAYLKPTSRVARDITFLRESLHDQIHYQGYGYEVAV